MHIYIYVYIYVYTYIYISIYASVSLIYKQILVNIQANKLPMLTQRAIRPRNEQLQYIASRVSDSIPRL